MSENLISIQQYAIKHKLSTFAAVKLINQGKIKTIKKVINDEEREFVVLNDTANTPIEHTNTPPTTIPTNSLVNYEEQYYELLVKYSVLQEKYTQLLEKTTLHPM